MNTRTVTLTLDELTDVISVLEEALASDVDMPDVWALMKLIQIFKAAR